MREGTACLLSFCAAGRGAGAGGGGPGAGASAFSDLLIPPIASLDFISSAAQFRWLCWRLVFGLSRGGFASQLHDGDRRVVSRVRRGRAVLGPATLPGRERRRPARRDHQGARHPGPGGHQHDEPQLHRVQISADKQGMCAVSRACRVWTAGVTRLQQGKTGGDGGEYGETLVRVSVCCFWVVVFDLVRLLFLCCRR